MALLLGHHPKETDASKKSYNIKNIVPFCCKSIWHIWWILKFSNISVMECASGPIAGWLLNPDDGKEMS